MPAPDPWKVSFSFASGVWTDVEISTSDLSKTELLWKDLSPADSSISFSVPYTDTIANLLRSVTDKEVPVKILRYGSNYFNGYLRKNFQFRKTQRDKPIKVECVTGGFLLKKKNLNSILYTGQTVSYIVSALLQLAGVPVGKITLPVIAVTIPYYFIDELESTYSAEISTLLYEYGYVGYFDDSGQFVTQELFPADTSTLQIFDGSNCYSEILQSKNEEAKERISVQYNDLITVNDALVFSDTTGGTAGFPCYITIQPNEYYTPDQTIPLWEANYAYMDKDIVAVTGATLDATFGYGITAETFTPKSKFAELKIKNSDVIPSLITKLNIIGDVIYIGDTKFSIVNKVLNTEKVFEYKSKYIYDSVSADYLANGLAIYYSKSDFKYTIRSKDNFALGSFVIINEMGSIQARIVEKKYTDEEIITYICEGVTDYTADVVENRIINIQPTPLPPSTINYIATEIDTATTNILGEVYDGFTTDSGGTTTPVDLTVYIEPQYKAIIVRWEKQLNLTNVKEYWIQVSDNGTDWYALRYDRIDWKETLGAKTISNANMIVHTLPNKVVLDVATQWTLYYRVKQVTKSGVESAYVTVSGTSLLVESGDIAANSIKANMLQTGTINSAIAKISSYISIDGTNGFMGINPNGLRRIFLDEDELTVEVSNGTDWSSTLERGGLWIGRGSSQISVVTGNITTVNATTGNITTVNATTVAATNVTASGTVKRGSDLYRVTYVSTLDAFGGVDDDIFVKYI